MSDTKPTDEFDLDRLAASEQQQLRRLAKKASGELDATSSASGISRRGVLGSIAAGGLGGLGVLGGLSRSSTPSQASSGSAAQTQAVGNVGEPGNPVDVYGASVNAEELLGTYPGEIRVFAQGEVVGSIDISSTSTPVQDAMDLADAQRTGDGEGTVVLPPPNRDNPIQEATALDPYPRVSIIAPHPSPETVTVEIQGDGEHGMAPSQDVYYATYQGWGLRHANADTGNTGNAIEMSSGFRNCVWRDFGIFDWTGCAIHLPSGTGAFQNTFAGKLDARNIDAGNEPAMFHFENFGPAWTFGNVYASPVATTSGANSTIVRIEDKGTFQADTINIGGSTGRAFHQGGGEWNLGTVSYEPSAQQSTPPNVFWVDRDRTFSVDNVALVSGAADYCYGVNDAENAGLGPVRVDSGFTLNNTVASVNGTPGGPGEFAGPLSQATNLTGSSLSEPDTLYCLDGPVT